MSQVGCCIVAGYDQCIVTRSVWVRPENLTSSLSEVKLSTLQIVEVKTNQNGRPEEDARLPCLLGNRSLEGGD